MIKDSGNRIKFDSGAVRDIHDGKGRCDLLPLDIVSNVIGEMFLSHIENFKQTSNKECLYLAIDIAINNLGFKSAIDAILEVSIQFEEGAKKYGEHNWQKGIPVSSYLDSAVRHYLKHIDGWIDERHDRAVLWNLLCAIWTCENKPELNVYLKGDE